MNQDRRTGAISRVGGTAIVLIVLIAVVGTAAYAYLNMDALHVSVSTATRTMTPDSSSNAFLNETAATTSYSNTSSPSFTNSGNLKVVIEPGSAANTTSVYYSPPTITVVIGVNNTVTWINDDQAPHTVTADDGSFDSGNMNQGDEWSNTFTTVGAYAYHCDYHPWMTGTIIVEPAA